MSWEAWVWRRAAAKAWKTPKPEVAMMRLKRAERFGVSYKELTAAHMDSGAYLGAAVLPLSLAARVRRGPNREIIVEARNSVAALVAKFRGRLFVLGDIDAVPGLSEAERADFLAILNRAFDGKVEAIGWGHDGPPPRPAEGQRPAASGGVPGVAASATRCWEGRRACRSPRTSIAGTPRLEECPIGTRALHVPLPLGGRGT